MCVIVAVIRIHDDQCQGLTRSVIVSLIIVASGFQITRPQAERTWDKTIHPYGKAAGLLVGYVKPQEGTSKRGAAGALDKQKEWHLLCDEMFRQVKERAFEVLQDKALVEALLPYLQVNLDEECVHALGKNKRVVGSKGKKKHDNENASSRSVIL